MSWADEASEKELNISGFYPEPTPDITQKPMPTYWKMKDGTLIEVAAMETSHINNCIAMLQRSIVDPYAWGEPDGEAAHDAFMQGVRQQEAHNAAIEHNINIFKKELKRRGEV